MIQFNIKIYYLDEASKYRSLRIRIQLMVNKQITKSIDSIAILTPTTESLTS